MTSAPPLWEEARDKLINQLSGEYHNIEEPYLDGATLHIGPIAVGPNAPTFTATLTPHPLANEDYNSAYYQRPPYSEMTPAVSNSNPLGPEWIRVRVTASDGPVGHKITRSISVDFKITKKIPYAILSKSRVMIGRNVMVDGPIGSSFTETNLKNGHPVQMASDFGGLNDSLDKDLEALTGTLISNDINGDNRISVASQTETDGIDNPEQYDVNDDGYIDDYDFFMADFDANADGKITLTEMENKADDDIRAKQLLELIDTFGYGPGDPPPSWTGDPSTYPGRPGYGDGVIDEKDRYAKIRGEVHITANMQDWNDGAANGAYQDYFQGAIHPDHDQSPLNFQADKNDVYEFGPEDFDVSSFRASGHG